MAKRLIIFTLVALLSFLIGVSLTRLRSVLFDEKHEPSPWELLLRFENQDLRRLDDESIPRVGNAIVEVTGEAVSDPENGFRPAFFGAILNTKGEKRYVLVEDKPLMFTPSSAWLRVHIFDGCGRLLSNAEFNAGYKLVLTNARVGKMPEMEHELLIIETGNYFGGGSGTRVYYALIGNRLALVYSTVLPWGMSQYYFDSNDYQDWNMTLGPLISRSVEEWEAALNSDESAEVLSALIWLGGHHWTGQPAPYDEEKPEAEKAYALLARAPVHKRLKRLSESDNSWIKTAAEAALENRR